MKKLFFAISVGLLALASAPAFAHVDLDAVHSSQHELAVTEGIPIDFSSEVAQTVEVSQIVMERTLSSTDCPITFPLSRTAALGVGDSHVEIACTFTT